jgi:hypothetical protein
VPLGVELLDDPRADPVAVRAHLRDITRLNRLFGGTRSVVQSLEPLWRSVRNEPGVNGKRLVTLLDVGTGAGDIPAAIVRAARRSGITVVPFGLEIIPEAARLARGAGVLAVIGSGDHPPLEDKSVDIVTASQVLHHLPPAQAATWIARFDRLARRAVVVADLYRSYWAMAGMWLAAQPLGLSRTSRHDAVLSLRRGYRLDEFRALCALAGVPAKVRRAPLARVVAVWEPR